MMTIVTVDFETYYSKEYSLSKMSQIDYILSPLFQTIMASVKVGEAPVEAFVGHERVARRLAEVDWSTTALLSHNTRFDGAIMAWHYGHVPKVYLDTLSMARATTHSVLGKSSLAAVSDYLGLPPKGDEVVKAIGWRLEDFPPDALQRYVAYCMRDTENCYEIFKRLRPCFNATELYLIDIVLRMFILPQVQLNPDELAAHLGEVKAERAAVFE